MDNAIQWFLAAGLFFACIVYGVVLPGDDSTLCFIAGGGLGLSLARAGIALGGR